VEKEAFEDVTQAISTIENRSKGLLNFVEIYRNLTRIPKPHFRYFGLQQLIERALDLLEPKLQKYEIQCTFKVFPKDLKVLADPDLIDQVIINLLLNAIDAAREVEERKITIVASVNLNNRTTVEIADSGKGISQDIMDKIFMPFFTSKQSGSGIGLSLSRQIMQMHKGSISVRSKPGEGAVFTLVF